MLVARLRRTWVARVRPPPAPQPGALRKAPSASLSPAAPEPGDAIDVDLIVTGGKPYWPQERKARTDNVCLGPLRDDADVWLTGTVVKRGGRSLRPTRRSA